MAAVVDDYSGLTLDELKSQLQAVVAEIGAVRVRELYAGHTPSPGIEVRYLKLYEAMKKWGLGPACLPPEERVRALQQHPLWKDRTRHDFVPPAHPVDVPRFAGSH